ncbi:MAG: flippase [Bryobacteraceae bacterium]
MNPRRRLQENIAALSILQLLCYIAPLLTVPYLVRVLKPPQFGLLSFAQGVVLVFDLITDYGFNFTATRAIASQRHDPYSISRIFWSTLWAKAALMLGSGAVLMILVVFIPKLHETAALYGVSFLYVIGTAIFPVWFFQGLEQMKISAIALGAARILTIPALFLYVKHEQDYVIAAGIQASVQVTATVFVAPILFRHMRLRWYRPSFADLTQAFKAGWPLFASGSALYFCTSSATVVLGLVAGKTAVGYYSAAEKLVKACISILSPVTQALYPHIATAKETSIFSALQLIRKGFLSIGLLSLCASFTTLILAAPICHIVLGPAFAPSVQVLRWLSPLPLLFGLMSVFGTQTMLVFEMDAVLCWVMLAGAAVGIPIIAVLSSFFGAVGTAAAVAILTAIIVLMMFFILRIHGLRIWRQSEQRNSDSLAATVSEHTEF